VVPPIEPDVRAIDGSIAAQASVMTSTCDPDQNATAGAEAVLVFRHDDPELWSAEQ
jgi:hypothetical protein